MKLKGSIVPIITPFRDGKIDYKQLEKIIEFQISEGSHGILPCGTTGESATMSHEEHMELVGFVVEKVAGRVPVVAGTGSNSTSEAIRLTEGAKKVGASAHLSITPYYNKPMQEGLFRHYQAITDACDLPMIVYNCPGRTAVNLTVETVSRLSEIPAIVGIKESSGSVEHAIEIMEATPDDFLLFSATDSLNYPILACGAVGVMSVTANIVPGVIAKTCDAVESGDFETAKRLHFETMPLHRAMFFETNPVPVKQAALYAGILEHLEYRLPLCEMSEANASRLKSVMADLNLVK